MDNKLVQTKFGLFFAEYDFTVEYIKGFNVVGDALKQIRICVEDLRAMSNDITSLNKLRLNNY